MSPSPLPSEGRSESKTGYGATATCGTSFVGRVSMEEPSSLSKAPTETTAVILSNSLDSVDNDVMSMSSVARVAFSEAASVTHAHVSVSVVMK